LERKRERGREWIRLEAREGETNGGKKKKEGAREKRNRGEREVEFSQGLMRKFRKLQGPFCKT
jgi:hypothetical protein